MKRHSLPIPPLFGCLLLLWVFSGCAHTGARPDTVAQVSTLAALKSGAYHGVVPVSALRQHGTLGIGTFHGLDGEMVMLNGEIWQVLADGRVQQPAKTATTPFAMTVPFSVDEFSPLPLHGDQKALENLVDRIAPDPDLFVAIKAEGSFLFVKTRSIPPQSPPYPPLATARKEATRFMAELIDGTLVGFRTPDWAKALNGGGYHFHFISDDKRVGGHVLDFAIASGGVKVDICHQFFLILPEAGATLFTGGHTPSALSTHQILPPSAFQP